MAQAKLTKKEIDVKIERLLKIDQESKTLAKEIKEIKTTLEAQYVLTPDQKETIYGNITYLEKVPVELGKNSYDIEKLRPYLKAIRGGSKAIKKIEVLDTKILDAFVKEGKLPPEALSNCNESKWTFKSMFKRIETVAANIIIKDKKAKKAI
jgi:hypothetical protein